MKTLIALAAALTALVAASPAPAVAAAPTIEIKPAQLERGEDSTVPRMVGEKVIVDGDTRIELEKAGYLLGRSGDEYVVASYPRLLRVSADGSTEQITRFGEAADLQLAADGEHVLISRVDRDRSTIRVVDSTSGDEVALRHFPGYVGVLDADGSRAVLTGTSPDRTLWWNFASDTTRRIVGRAGGSADIRADRLATLTGDPYEGGCAVVTQLSRPRHVLWRSCEDIPVAFSPKGSRMATVDILADGLGPGAVTARRTDGGKALATYTAHWFAAITWETEKALVMDANTKHRAATVRCVAADCERASGLRRP